MAGYSLLSREEGLFLARALRACDGQLQAVLLLGSAVYAPELARDLDLLLISRAPRRVGAYARALRGTCRANVPPADLLVWPAEEPAGALRLAVASARVLWRRSADLPLWCATSSQADFADARARLELAAALMVTRRRATPDFAPRFAQEAFETLFLACRTAAQALVAGRSHRALPAVVRLPLQALVAACHLRYGQEARLPVAQRELESEFSRWRQAAARIVEMCAAQAGQAGPAPAGL